MSTGFMSCVREHSPPLEIAGCDDINTVGDDSGAVSLPVSTGTMQIEQKRRRFNPLKNLRRIFRRRTVNSGDVPTTLPEQLDRTTTVKQSQQYRNSTEKNSIIETTTLSVPAHHYYEQQQHHQQRHINPSSLPPDLVVATTSTSSSSSTLAPNEMTSTTIIGATAATTSTTIDNNIDDNNVGSGITTSISLGRSPIGIRVFPQLISTSASQSPSSGGYNHLLKKNQLMTSGNSVSCDKKILIKLQHNDDITTNGGVDENTNENSHEMTDNQRCLSEGRLVDSEINCDLSQSHDSVFSESAATASSLSIGLKNELFDVLRKRRNRPSGGSDEDSGLPHSPSSQKSQHLATPSSSSAMTLTKLSKTTTRITGQQQHQKDGNNLSASLQSVSSSTGDLDDEFLSSTHISEIDKSSSYSSAKILSCDLSRTSDEIDMSINSSVTRLSHSAARHKMAVRPKKKGPTKHRRPIESNILPTTLELNEDLNKNGSLDVFKDIGDKAKSLSLPPGVNAKIIEQHNFSMNSNNGAGGHIKRSRTEKGVSQMNESFSLRNILKKTHQDELTDTINSMDKKHDDESGFFKRFLPRNSRKVASKSIHSDEIDNESKIMDKHSQNVEEKRQEIRREIMSEGKSGLSAMLNSFILSTADQNVGHIKYDPSQNNDTVELNGSSSNELKQLNKPKSGPAARQRVMPKDLQDLDIVKPSEFVMKESKLRSHSGSESSDCSGNDLMTNPKVIIKISNEHLNVTPSLSSNWKMSMKTSSNNSSELEETFSSHSVIREIMNVVPIEHFEKHEHHLRKPKIVGLSAFQHKVLSDENVDFYNTADEQRHNGRQRKSVEKSKSFRYYSEDQNDNSDKKLKKYDNMPSLPDLTYSSYESYQNKIDINDDDDDDVGDDDDDDDSGEGISTSLGFKINDNNLIRNRTKSNTEKSSPSIPLSQGIFTKNIILTTSKPSAKQHQPDAINTNINEIEHNIDKILIKSTPFVSVLKKSTSMTDASDSKAANVSITAIKKPEINYCSTQQQHQQHYPKEILSTNNDNIENITKSLEHVEQQPTSLNEISKSIDSIFPKIETRSNNDLKSAAMVSKACRNTNISTIYSPASSTSLTSSSSSIENTNEQNCTTIVPEFMKIQLNRVSDPNRIKNNNVILSKNIKIQSDESVLQTGRALNNTEHRENKPPLPPLPVDIKRNSCHGVVISRDDYPSIESLKNSTNKSDDYVVIRNKVENSTSIRSSSSSSSSNGGERRKSVTDEKLKYEKKIEEMNKNERKKSLTLTDDCKTTITSQQQQLRTDNKMINSNNDDEICQHNNNNNNNVVLRKKSFGNGPNQSSSLYNLNTPNGNDTTPELMKVFARRSLKLKDDDDDNNSERTTAVTLLRKFTNLDSDKENQSSSEEKLDKVEITIQSQQKLIQQQQQQPKIDDKPIRNSLVDSKKINNNNTNSNNNINNNNNNNNNVGTIQTPTKPFNCYGNNLVNNYNRNSNNNSNNNNNNVSTTTSPSKIVQSTNNMIKMTNKIPTIESSSNLNEPNNNKKLSITPCIRHTIGTSILTPSTINFDIQQMTTTTTTTATIPATTTATDNEFKGILQRRAEWEKRAKEASK